MPLDGTGLQTHLLDGTVAPGVIADLIDRLTEIGLDVATTELDVLLTASSDPLAVQAEA